MKLSDLLRMSWQSLLKRKFRTFLTVLGVVIGVISIVVMVSLGIGMKSAMLEEMESYGSMKSIEVTRGYSDMSSSDDKEKKDEHFLNDALVAQFEQLEHVDFVVPQLSVDSVIKIGKYQMNIRIIGLSPEGMLAMNPKVGAGQLPLSDKTLELFYGNLVPMYISNAKTGQYIYWETGEWPDVDFMNETPYVIFDAERYYSHGQTDANGQLIQAPKKYLIPTAGVLEGGQDDYSSMSYDVYCNIDALKATLKKEFKGRVIPGQPTKKGGKPYKDIMYNTIIVYVDNMDNVTAVQDIIKDMGYNTYSQAEWIESDMQILNIVQLVLGGIGAVALFVAAIGITNTMSMSIYERTKEIGIMKVIGCKISDIQFMFLAEAGFIGFIGGIIGVSISAVLSVVINWLIRTYATEMGMQYISVIPPWLILVSIIFAVLIGMIAGFFPSLRAMKLSPLSAIRNE